MAQDEIAPEVEATVETVETESTPVSETTRVVLNDEEFFDINEEVAKSDNPTIDRIAELTGLAVTTVKQRRSQFNSQFRSFGITLTGLPRGGHTKKNKDVSSIAAKLLAKRAEAEASDTEPVETETEAE